MRRGRRCPGQVRAEQRQEVHQVVLCAFLQIMKFCSYDIIIDTVHFHLDSFTNWKEILPSAAIYTHFIYTYIMNFGVLLV